MARTSRVTLGVLLFGLLLGGTTAESENGYCVVCCSIMIVDLDREAQLAGCDRSADCKDVLRNASDHARRSMCRQLGFEQDHGGEDCRDLATICSEALGTPCPEGTVEHTVELYCDCDGDGTPEPVKTVKSCDSSRPGFIPTAMNVRCDEWATGSSPPVGADMREQLDAWMSGGQACPRAQCHRDFGSCNREATKERDTCQLRHLTVPGRRIPGACMDRWMRDSAKCVAERDRCLS